ncbi:MAG: hypothetical protein WDA02_07520 [Saccharofermentanales bacterium]
MKSPEEILKSIGIKPTTKHHDYNYLYNAVLKCLFEAQKEAWNEAIDKASENLKLKLIYEHTYDPSVHGEEYARTQDRDYIAIIDKDSIVKLKK